MLGPMRLLLCASAAALIAGAAPGVDFPFIAPAHAQVDVDITASIAPPPLPVYSQPPIPGPGFVWIPGYWSWDGAEWYWVPGFWETPPQIGYYWTPPYWAWDNGVYAFNAGYWGPTVGFYGGINYGFGYPGTGFYGGYWQNRTFVYNRAVNDFANINSVRTFNRPLVETHNRVAFNGGPGGVVASPTPAEIAARAHGVRPTAMQVREREIARHDPAMRFNNNHGAPQVAATQRAGVLHGPHVVAAHAAAAAAEAHATTHAPQVAARGPAHIPNVSARGPAHAPHFAGGPHPGGAQHFAAPHFAGGPHAGGAPHFAAPHFAGGPHAGGAAHFAAPHFAAGGPHAGGAPHFAASHFAGGPHPAGRRTSPRRTLPADRIQAGRRTSPRRTSPADRIRAGRRTSPRRTLPADRIRAGRSTSPRRTLPADRMRAGRRTSPRRTLPADRIRAGRRTSPRLTSRAARRTSPRRTSRPADRTSAARRTWVADPIGRRSIGRRRLPAAGATIGLAFASASALAPTVAMGAAALGWVIDPAVWSADRRPIPAPFASLEPGRCSVRSKKFAERLRREFGRLRATSESP